MTVIMTDHPDSFHKVDSVPSAGARGDRTGRPWKTWSMITSRLQSGLNADTALAVHGSPCAPARQRGSRGRHRTSRGAGLGKDWVSGAGAWAADHTILAGVDAGHAMLSPARRAMVKASMEGGMLHRCVRTCCAFLALAGVLACQHVMAQGIDDAVELHDAGRFDEAFSEFWRLAGNGHTAALHYLGRMYLEGSGVEEDPRTAALWFRLAAEHGHFDSIVQLAEMYRSGEGVPRDADEAARLALLAAKQGQDEVEKWIEFAISPESVIAAAESETAPALQPESVEASLDLDRAERRSIQAGLASLGFDPGPADGLFGRKTREALKAWQEAKGDDATGWLTADEAIALKAAGEAEEEARAAMRPGDEFRDCPQCPEMVVVPAGSFIMGSPASEADTRDAEGPQRRVAIAKPFAVGKFEVTFAEWDACVVAGGCNGYRPDHRGRGRGQRPVIRVNWYDSQSYIAWLSRETGEKYLLLSEAEWEYAARAGTRTRYHWGDRIGVNRANCWGCGGRWDGHWTAPAGSFRANGFGLHDMHGNVREWVRDCWHQNYAGAPSDGRAWNTGGDCARRVVRGGSWAGSAEDMRAAKRLGLASSIRHDFLGFRVARALAP